MSVGMSEKSKMAVCNRKWLWNNIYISLYTWCQRNSKGVLASSIITGLIRILFHVRVCVKFVAYIHLRLRPPSLIYHLPWRRTVFAQGQSCCSISRSRKHRYSRWNFVAISHCWATHYFICASGSRPPSLISHSPRQTAVFRFFIHTLHYSSQFSYLWFVCRPSSICWWHSIVHLLLGTWILRQYSTPTKYKWSCLSIDVC